jgi:hypothetical protein
MPPAFGPIGGCVVTKTTIGLRAGARLVAALSVSLSAAAPVRAADWPVAEPVIVKAPASNWTVKAWVPPQTYSGDFGLRFWYGRAKTGKNLYDTAGTTLVSRLTYDDLTIVSAEAFTRFELDKGWFMKSYLGAGGLWSGKLIDEDFPPITTPYSATRSSQKDGSPFYGSIDVGYNFVRGPDFHVGAFAGYHFLRETVNAFGCGQIAANPMICAGAVPDVLRVISQVNNWHSVRVGLDAEVEFGNRLKLNVDAAWLPYVALFGSDAHWLRIDPTTPGGFTGPLPEDGNGWGYQVDGFASYRISDWLSFGLGGRYWHMETKGHTHFEGHVVGFAALPQVVSWKTDNFGVFVQTSVKLGPYPLISSF